MFEKKLNEDSHQDFEQTLWSIISKTCYELYGRATKNFHCKWNKRTRCHEIYFISSKGEKKLKFVPQGSVNKKLMANSGISLQKPFWGTCNYKPTSSMSGFITYQQDYEESLWYKLCKLCYIVFGTSTDGFSIKFDENTGELKICYRCEKEEPVLYLTLSRSDHLEQFLSELKRRKLKNLSFKISDSQMERRFKIGLNRNLDLEIVPLIFDSDTNKYIKSEGLEKYRYGKYYYLSKKGFCPISERYQYGYRLFIPYKKTVIQNEKIPDFIAEVGEAIKSDRSLLVAPSLLNQKIINRCNYVKIITEDVKDDWYYLSIKYGFGNEELSFFDIYKTRKKKRKYLIGKKNWLAVDTSEYTWLDNLDEERINTESNTPVVRLNKYEYLKLHSLLPEKKYLEGRAEIKQHIENLNNLIPPTAKPILSNIRFKLRHYQESGYAWLWFLYENGLSGLLCDEMGLGKTHESMALMQAVSQKYKSRKIKFLVVCPTSVISHWRDKLTRYCPRLKPYIYHGQQRILKDYPVTVTSYGIVRRDIAKLISCNFDIVVLDEIQTIKNKSTQTFATVRQLNSPVRFGLTGTPVENSVTDLKAIFDFILPDYLGNDAMFMKQFVIPIEQDNNKKVKKQLSKIIRPFVLRRTKEQVLKELPAKIEDMRTCELSDDQVKLYRDIIDKKGVEIVKMLKSSEEKIPYMHIFAVLNYLKQICNHPVMLEHGSTDYQKYVSGKWDLFCELLSEILDSGQKVVVFSQYVKMLEIIEKYLKDKDITFATIKGSTQNRAIMVEKFNNNPNCKVFTGSLKASGLGIDLIGGSVVIHYDRWWNPAREEQATDRVHRIGQKKVVQVFKFVTEGTLEEKIDRILARKKTLLETIVKKDDYATVKHFDRNDLIELFAFKKR